MLNGLDDSLPLARLLRAEVSVLLHICDPERGESPNQSTLRVLLLSCASDPLPQHLIDEGVRQLLALEAPGCAGCGVQMQQDQSRACGGPVLASSIYKTNHTFTGCLTVLYCSPACAKSDWKRAHSKECCKLVSQSSVYKPLSEPAASQPPS